MTLLAVGLAGLAYSMVDIPSPNEMANAQASVVYYADGKTEMTRISGAGSNRESVPIEKIPTVMRYAVMSAEDRDFLENPGISITGLGRAVWGAIRGENAGGGSTITQQYVKNYFLTSDQTLTRKGKELSLIHIFGQVGADLLRIHVERGDELDVAHVVAAEFDVHQARHAACLLYTSRCV